MHQMDSDEIKAAGARRRRQKRILAAFGEIAPVYLSGVRGNRITPDNFASLQQYLDEKIAINGGRDRRRAVLLAVHDMKEKIEAPALLRNVTKARLMSLRMQPIPKLESYSDVATALLRMEAVMRESASQSPQGIETQSLLYLYGIAQLTEYRQRLNASLTAATASAKSLSDMAGAYSARVLLQVRKAAAWAATVSRNAWRAPAVRQTVSLPST
jgi:hypothetical protein